jgi:hypothetical protein
VTLRSAILLAAILSSWACGRSELVAGGSAVGDGRASSGGSGGRTDAARDAGLGEGLPGVPGDARFGGMGESGGAADVGGTGGTGGFAGTAGTLDALGRYADTSAPGHDGGVNLGGGFGTGVAGISGGSPIGAGSGQGGTTSQGGSRVGSASAVTGFAITSFTASPATVTLGHSTTLSWTLVGGPLRAVLSIDDQAVASVTGGTSKVVTPNQTETYALTAENANGESVTAQVLVTVVPLPTIVSFTASPPAIDAGASASLAEVDPEIRTRG